MANKARGGQVFWAAASVTAGDTSAVAYADGDVTVAVFINNTGGTSTVIDIQVSDNVTPSAGRNNVPSTFYDYLGADAITVAAGKAVCFDLTPFGPSFIRLKSSATTTLDAFCTVIG